MKTKQKGSQGLALVCSELKNQVLELKFDGEEMWLNFNLTVYLLSFILLERNFEDQEGFQMWWCPLIYVCNGFFFFFFLKYSKSRNRYFYVFLSCQLQEKIIAYKLYYGTET
eukprot:TRINITY_DN3644_c1_g1_i1.p3 TRINITY_DN3644_c1_g1~~TRINITY_DN3644_c1_g1_i1.p3  ORF type:complete len:112 (-),score=2.36 TRINITY_DN3644_c1_g1_i1:424-759(-)